MVNSGKQWHITQTQDGIARRANFIGSMQHWKTAPEQLTHPVDRDLTVSFTLRQYSGDSAIASTAEHAPKAAPCSHAVA
jgi:hypothetical protein